MRRLCLLLLIVVTTFAPAGFAANPIEVTSTGTWSSGTYVYDGSGNIKAIGTNAYRYDTAGRLISGTVSGASNTQTYNYDAFGNRILATTTGSGCVAGIDCQENVTIDPATNHITSNGAGYDAAGNLIAFDGGTYTYDSVSRLRSQSNTGAQFIYNAGGERIATIRAGGWNWSIRDLNGHVLSDFASTDGGGGQIGTTNFQWKKDYVYRGSLLVATATAAGTQHFHLDHLGTPRLITDANGAEIGAHSYFPFGGELTLTPTEANLEVMKFTGHERDYNGALQDLDYMHARFYNAAVGRFLSVDPALNLKLAMANPQAWNRYAYVMNNPLRFTDPTGQEHVQEPGFTKPLSEADWSDAPPIVRAAFNAEGALLSLAAAEFGGGLYGTVRGLIRLVRGAPSEPEEPTLRADVKLSGGRSGQGVKTATGPPNSIIRGSDGRIYQTNDKGQIIADITKERVKPVTPGQGFGPKRAPTGQELSWLEKMARVIKDLM